MFWQVPRCPHMQEQRRLIRGLPIPTPSQLRWPANASFLQHGESKPLMMPHQSEQRRSTASAQASATQGDGIEHDSVANHRRLVLSVVKHPTMGVLQHDVSDTPPYYPDVASVLGSLEFVVVGQP